MNSTKHHKISVLFFILFCSLFCSCGKEEIPKSSLEIRDNLLYKKNSNVPFTGRERALVDHKIIDYEVKDGLKHGKFRIFSEDGILEMEGQIDSNRNVGNWKYFYSDGKIESEGNFNLDRPDGKWIWNYPDGKKREEGNYQDGIRVGMWYQYDSNGEVISEKNYDLVDSLDSEIDSSNFFDK
jgi:antitoxin component YwqK of YwqJK toxin-antitoxin module